MANGGFAMANGKWQMANGKWQMADGRWQRRIRFSPGAEWVKDLGMDMFLEAAIEEARKGLAEGGIPIGSVLVFDGKIIGRGHNQRVQRGSVIHHAEMNCLENAGRLAAAVYRRCVLYSTLSPCPMCSGAALLYKIPRVVIGENVTFRGPEEYVRSLGVQVEVLQDAGCIQLMRGFIAFKPELWNEDIGE
jgi:creatinine deaminase